MSTTERGIVFNVPHFPGRAPIDAYGNGGFRFADMSHRGSILCLPAGIMAWRPTTVGEIDATVFDEVLASAADIDILLVGTGIDLVPLAPALKAAFREVAISADPMSTGAAVRTYNVLLAENRAVAAALLAVE